MNKAEDQEKIYPSSLVAEILQVSRQHVRRLRERSGVTPDVRINTDRNMTAIYYSLEDMARLKASIRRRPKRRKE